MKYINKKDEVTMMRTIQTNIYSFYELSKEAQERAFNEWLSYAEYPYFDDFNETVKEFESLFNGYIRIKEVNYTYGRGYFRSNFDEDVENLSGVRLAKYLWNNYGDSLYKGKYYASNYNPNRELKTRRSKVIFQCECPLTGCYTDCLILDELIKFMHRPEPGITLIDLLERCLDTFASKASDNIESWYCMDVFNDECEVNDWEFLENGDRYYA